MDSALATKTSQPRRKWLRIFLISLLVFALLLTTVAAYGYWMVTKSKPVMEGELVLPGLTAEVSVYRDAHGVPTIVANNLDDLYYSQGYITAQERLFQMDLSRRKASGQLSEIMGESMLDEDKFYRTLGLRRAAKASWEAYSEEAKHVLTQYTLGVNAYIAESTRKGKLPIEFTLVNYKPAPWTAIDSLVIAKLMAYDLSGNWTSQVFRAYLTKNFSAEKVADLLTDYPADSRPIVEAVQSSSIDLKKSFATADIPHESNGSNNWVIAGNKSASGKPILANDPHLGLNNPSIWFETTLIAPQMEVSGVIFAGIPGIILGNNRHVAWGVTTAQVDTQDLYIEERNPANKYQFRYNDKWEEAQVFNEIIKVKGAPDLSYEVVITRHGPIISEFAHDDRPDHALALKWTALQPTKELEAVIMFNKAKNWEEFKQALTNFQSPVQNFVFAAEDGTIAFRSNGYIPIRKKGDSSLPVPGWTDEYEWQGYIPWEELPTLVNPPSGLIASANNKVADDSYPYHLTHDYNWSRSYRYDRIMEVLASKDTLTVRDMQQLQLDQKSRQAATLLPILLDRLEQSEQRTKLRGIDAHVLDLLKKWDHVDRPESAASLVYFYWIKEIQDYLFTPAIDAKMLEMFSPEIDHLILESAQEKEGPWLKEKGGLEAVAFVAFQKAVDRAVAVQGDDPDSWQWGKTHQVRFAHPVGEIKPLDLLFNPTPRPMGGSDDTVAMAATTSEGEAVHGAPWRRVIDMADKGASFNSLVPGQSGHFYSPWYEDQIDDWIKGNYHRSNLDANSYQTGAHHLLLKPPPTW
ncbi:penicillin acylase family protein [Brevibacillus sp. 179-C9.3 HS]|uniref:penicillin acylase family protein n=1 Tax=unclassified Brevibacillus TaxID=2684853 RepID=UPI0039A22CAA